MCGIIGITSEHSVSQALLSGLQRLEYRGYDSTGLALQTTKGLQRLRAPGKLQALREAFMRSPLEGNCGIGHTRWATHGAPHEMNAHPQGNSSVMVVHNGIIENFLSLKEELMRAGYIFESDTDTEVLVHLLHQALQNDLPSTPEALSLLLRSVFKHLEGSFACVVILKAFPDTLICYRQGNSPLAIGWGEKEMYCGSDAIALSGLSNVLAYLEDQDLVLLTPHHVLWWDKAHQATQRPRIPNPIALQSMSKNHYTHFMRKEIEEQPIKLRHLLSQDFAPSLSACSISQLSSLTLVACGTAYYAGCIAATWFETYARLRTHVEIASEFRYRRPPLPLQGMTAFISQSGETVDTLGALAYAQEMHQHTLAIVNVPSSSLDRLADLSLQTHAGPEIGVASTKAFTSQLLILARLALHFGCERHVLRAEDIQMLQADLDHIPELLKQVLLKEPKIQDISSSLAQASSALYLGRGAMAPLACEGALKLKELSYIHAEGYPAGEMKHGPIALLDSQLPVIVCAPFDSLFEKTLGSIQEVAARGAPLFILTDEKGEAFLSHLNAALLILPPTSFLTAPFVYAVALQLLAYHVACLKGTDVDQPRNLAKSVTVE